jgi:hypothetical protein
MTRNEQRAQKMVTEAWNNAYRSLRQMNNSIQIRPQSPTDIFQLDPTASNDEVKFIVGPIVFYVPERATDCPNLYIVVKGELSFEVPCCNNLPLKTKKFKTQVAYFRSRRGILEHVFGAHYDLDEERPGHPVFHAQFCSQKEFFESVRDKFRLNDAPEDYIKKTLGTVRVPCAQMDVFSVITQICADHLIWKDSGSEVKSAFRSLREKCDFFVGAAHRMDFLKQPPASECYRSTYWYRSPLANA